MLGEAFSGLLVSINRVITKLTIENNLTNTIIFFTLSIIGEIVSVRIASQLLNLKRLTV